MTILYLLVLLTAGIQNNYAQENPVYVDETGILRWSSNKQEASFYGVNYTAPFAYSYRNLKKLGIPVKEAIDIDVEHFARLELNAFRIHVWDREVSDRDGNLLNNEHIELLDYLIHKLKQKGIYTILTPIAWWGTGWPEPDPETPGFSTFYSKEKMISEPEAKRAQENYIKQFLNHINRYDNVSYKNDTSVIAFEIINEPHHPADTSFTSTYIKEMVRVFRNEGVTKPVYYNISENWPGNPEAGLDKVAVIYNADVDGISFQWYPAGLVKRSMLKGNFLPHVDHYPVPDINNKSFKSKTRMVYEFDAADIGDSYMYPAMARSFREAGMQWATMFCYDPTPLAEFNSEYQTHFLNLLYTPQKALGMLIATNVFKEVGVYQKFESYPANFKFKDFIISYEKNLAEMNSEKKFYYTNNTASVPKNIKTLEHIAGYGNSPVVQTDSKGSYFIDKISEGLWKLELYPDAVWLKDPFGINSINNKVADLFYNKSEIKISLPDLSRGFNVFSKEQTSGFYVKQGESFSIKPGSYIISAKELPGNEMNKYLEGNPKFIYKENLNNYVIHEPVPITFEGKSCRINAGIYSAKEIKKAQLFIRQRGWQRFNPIDMIKTSKYNYYAELPGYLLKNSTLEYCIYIETGKDSLVFPGGQKGFPNKWDFAVGELWKTKVVPENNPYVLFNPAVDYNNIIFPALWGAVEFTAGAITGKDNEDLFELRFNKFKQPLKEITFQIELNHPAGSNIIDWQKYSGLAIKLNNSSNNLDTVYIRIVTVEGTAGVYPITKFDKQINTIPFEEFRSDNFVLLPRPYPHFLPYYSTVNNSHGELIKSTLPGYLQVTIPLQDLGETANGTTITIGKIELISKNDKEQSQKNE